MGVVWCVQITREVDRVYAQSESNNIPDISIVDRSDKDRVLVTVKKTAYLEEPFSTFEALGVDCVLWNPWIEKAAALADMDDDGYTKYVCVEPGTVSNWVNVPPGKALVLNQTLQPGGV